MTLFTEKAPAIMSLLMADFDLTEIEAAAIVGNLGHESGGFKFLQEIKPMVPGSRGGYGWAQWTGPRRRAFEAYVVRNQLNPASDKANYGFLFVELTTTEAKAIPAVKAADGLAAKVKAFELAFERAGVKHYPSRIKYAEQALAAFKAQDTSGALKPPVVIPPPPDIEPIEPPPAQPAKSAGFSLSAAVGILITLSIAAAIAAKVLGYF
jgi:hypothetical protein